MDDTALALELIRRAPCRYMDVVDALGREHKRAQAALRRLEDAGEIRWLSNGWLVLPRRRIHPARDTNAVPLFDDGHPATARGSSRRVPDPSRPDPAADRRGP